MSISQVFGHQGLRLIQEEAETNSQSVLTFVHAARAALLFSVLAFIVVFQLIQIEFINVSVWLPVYIVMFPIFLINSFYFLFIEKFAGNPWIDGFLFSLDIVCLSLVVHYTGGESSAFVIPLLVILAMAGFILPRWLLLGAVALASICYSFSLIANISMTGGTLYSSLLFNNVAFMGIGFLSHLVGREILNLGLEVNVSRAKIETLESLNTLIVDNIASGLVTVNASNVITRSNASAGEILGKSDLKGKHISNVFPEVYHQLMSSDRPIGRGSVLRLELELERDELLRVIEGLISPLIDHNGEKQGYLFLFQDLTDLKQMERQVRQQDKLAAVGQLAAGIAHEIRNPLASISGSIQLLVASPENLKDEDLKLMRIVLREIDRLNKLISEFLEFVRPDVMATDLVDLNALMTEVLEMVRFNKSLPDRVDQKISLASPGTIIGHRDKLKQAFLNIIINSYQAMVDREERVIDVSIENKEDKLLVRISDTGAGIEKKTLDRIFEPFLTTKPKGTGLGLAITHKILESHGAQVNVVSEVDKGTRFEIEFDARLGDLPKEDVGQKQA